MVQSSSQCKCILKKISFIILMKMIIGIGLCEPGIGSLVVVITTISNVIQLTIVYENGDAKNKIMV